MSEFKCLSVSQPFADLVVNGKKTIETRKWNTKYRGEFLIHAPHKIRNRDCERLKIDKKALSTGAIVGKASIYDVKVYRTEKEWRQDKLLHFASDYTGAKYGFLLKNAKKFNAPIPCMGRLGFFNVKLDGVKTRDKDITTEIFDEEYRTRWINYH